MKGTETQTIHPAVRGEQGHGGVPLVKGTETKSTPQPRASRTMPRRCPPREGD